ncbi:MAG TPA: DUF4062 domain-containing protein [Planctomycetota bacterium]|nr:DUF4062 domain-containing protein [Planctomycetota bacterium]
MPDDRAEPVTLKPRVIRVFVSSTFRDMHDEREELVKRIFPQLRKLCEARGVAFADVDLRWGIPDERKAEGKVLPICLEEIQRCRPFFIGLLGERYGWVPDDIPGDLVAQQPWLAEHRTKSVTELEMLHGVLNNRAMANRACFYFRDPAYIERVPTAQRADFVEEDPPKRAKLAALKQRVRDSRLAIEQYRDPQHLGELVLHDLTIAINQEFPETEPPSQLDRDAADHEAFAQSRTGVYIGRQEYFDRLDAHAAGDGPPLVILGESGSGKSALLANWALRHREKHPDDLVLMHFIGSSPYSSDWAAMLRRILGEFNRRLDLKIEIPDKPDALRLTFANALHMAAARLSGGTGVGGTGVGGTGVPPVSDVAQPLSAVSSHRIILILDALNQLEDRDGAPDLVWLPPVVPAGVRLLLSTLPGRPLDDLRKRGWPTLDIEPLNPSERSDLITRYLAQYTKALSPSLADQIAAAPQAANPLYLRALLEELRVFGSHEQLSERIRHYLAARTIPELYEKILARYEQDYERERPGLVRDAMTALWAARRGLSEPELLDLLGTEGAPLPRGHWSHFAIPADHCFITRSGLVTFAHDYLRAGVRSRYLPTNREEKTAHAVLADFFAARQPCHRRTEEFPWHLHRSDQWERLRECLCDLTILDALWHGSAGDALAYWITVQRELSCRAPDAYHTIWPGALNVGRNLKSLGILFMRLGYSDQANEVFQAQAQTARSNHDAMRLADALRGLARLSFDTLQFAVARDVLGECASIYRSTGDEQSLARTLSELAAVTVQLTGAPRRGLELLQEPEGICRRIGDLYGLHLCLANRAQFLGMLGQVREAMQAYVEAERLCVTQGMMTELLSVRIGRAMILKMAGRQQEALTLLKLVEQEARGAEQFQLCAASLCEQADIFERNGRPRSTAALLRKAEPFFRRCGNRFGLAACLFKQACLHQYQHIFQFGARKKAEECLGVLLECQVDPGKRRDCAELLCAMHHQATATRTIGALAAAGLAVWQFSAGNAISGALLVVAAGFLTCLQLTAPRVLARHRCRCGGLRVHAGTNVVCASCGRVDALPGR